MEKLSPFHIEVLRCFFKARTGISILKNGFDSENFTYLTAKMVFRQPHSSDAVVLLPTFGLGLQGLLHAEHDQDSHGNDRTGYILHKSPGLQL